MAKFCFDEDESEVYDFDEFENVMYERYGDTPELEEYACETLDSCYEEVSIGNFRFSPSTVLMKCDPMAYGMFLDECLDSICEDARYALEHGDDCVLWDGTRISIIEDDEEDEDEDEEEDDEEDE